MITQEYLKSILHYDSTNGLFVWLINKGRRGKKGTRAGSVAVDQNGYKCRHLKIDGKTYKEHHLAWFYMTGEWCFKIDHRDVNGTNNVWENLRLATSSQNRMNTTARSDTASGYKGVHWCKTKQKWRVQISADGCRKNIGRFVDINDAINAYDKAAKEMHGEFARSR